MYCHILISLNFEEIIVCLVKCKNFFIDLVEACSREGNNFPIKWPAAPYSCLDYLPAYKRKHCGRGELVNWTRNSI